LLGNASAVTVGSATETYRQWSDQPKLNGLQVGVQGAVERTSFEAGSGKPG